MSTRHLRWRRLTPIGWTTLLFAAWLVLEASLLHQLTPLDLRGGDGLQRLAAKQHPLPPEVVLLDISQADLDDPRMLNIAGRWPWPRAIHGELLDALAAETPRAVVFDLTFTEPDTFRPDSDAVLIDALTRQRAYLPITITQNGQGSRLANLPSSMGIQALERPNLAATLPILAPKAFPPALWRTGHITFTPDEDGVGRHYQPSWQASLAEGWRVPGLAARVVRDLGVPVGDSPVRLNWYAQDFPRYAYAERFLAGQMSKPSKLVSLRGKIVIIGSAAPSLGDLRLTPLGASTPGPTILATTIANLLHQDTLSDLPVWLAPLIGLLLIAAIARLYQRNVHPAVIGAGVLLASFLAIVASYMGLHAGWYGMPFATLAIVWLYFWVLALLSFLLEKQERKRAIDTFGRYLDSRVVAKLLLNKNFDANMHAKSETISVLFSDIRGFTSLSETRTPEEIVALLNAYFNVQAAAIFESGGTLDKYIGDCIMAFWGAPIAMPDHAIRSVRTALEMVDRLHLFRAEIAKNHPNIDADSFDVGIGIHTGTAVVGSIGATQRLDYTAIGDTVNLASRIEGETKGRARVLVSEATRLACGDAFDFIEHGSIHVKGRQEGVIVYEPRYLTPVLPEKNA